ncbi:MAG: N-formylglutamate amidohydrolase [Haliea sp.]
MTVLPAVRGVSPFLPLVVHAPHAGTHVPAIARENLLDYARLRAELNRLTDWYTADLLQLPGASLCATPVSRLVVDLERYTDDTLEPRAAVGQGVIYTHDSRGQRLRPELAPEQRRQWLDHWYRPWHLKLELDVLGSLQRHGACLLVDAHSFPARPLANEIDAGRARPDICLGTGANTPAWLVGHALDWCARQGLSVAVDFPYAGCLVPAVYAADSRVAAIMVEVNRGLYLLQPDPAAAPALGADYFRVKAALNELLLGMTGRLLDCGVYGYGCA